MSYKTLKKVIGKVPKNLFEKAINFTPLSEKSRDRFPRRNLISPKPMKAPQKSNSIKTCSQEVPRQTLI